MQKKTSITAAELFNILESVAEYTPIYFVSDDGRTHSINHVDVRLNHSRDEEDGEIAMECEVSLS